METNMGSFPRVKSELPPGLSPEATVPATPSRPLQDRQRQPGAGKEEAPAGEEAEALSRTLDQASPSSCYRRESQDQEPKEEAAAGRGAARCVQAVEDGWPSREQWRS